MRIFLQFLAIVALVVVIAILALDRSTPMPPNINARADVGVIPSPTGVPVIAVAPPRPVAEFQEISTRPLLFPNRRQPAPISVQPPLPTPPPPAVFVPPMPPPATADAVPSLRDAANRDIVLHGVVVGDQDRRALLSIRGGALHWLDLGATLDGWTLAEVEPNYVRLRRDGITLSTKLYNQQSVD